LFDGANIDVETYMLQHLFFSPAVLFEVITIQLFVLENNLVIIVP
jgi:hypothetical protein